MSREIRASHSETTTACDSCYTNGDEFANADRDPPGGADRRRLGTSACRSRSCYSEDAARGKTVLRTDACRCVRSDQAACLERSSQLQSMQRTHVWNFYRACR